MSFALADGEDEMLAADTAFAAEDVRIFQGGSQPYAGRDLMIERYADWPEGAVLEWTPVEAVAAPGGGFGFTWGRYVYTRKDKTGEESVGHGKYVSIWRKESDGA